MAGLGSLVVELSANIGRFESAMTKANYSAQQNTRAIVKEVGSMRASFDSIPGAIARVTAAAGGLYAIGSVLKAGIKAADEFKTTVIGIAAGLTNIAKPGQGDFGTIFKRNMAFAEEMAKKLEEVAAKQFASPEHMMVAYNQLVQQGYALRMDEAAALGLVVDRIILAVGEQDKNRQINQEIRAIMQGTAEQGSLIAKELQSRLGPAWKDIVDQHRKAGDLLEWMAGLWPGMAAATEEVQNTLMAQGSTLVGHMKYLGREGLSGLYDDLVGMVKDINEYLKEHGRELAANIVTGWNAVKEVAGGVVLVVSEIVGWIKTGASYLSGWVSSLSAIAKQRADLGAGMGLDLMAGLGGGANASQGGVTAQLARNNIGAVNALVKQAEEAQKKLAVAMGPVPTQFPGGGGGGKGGGKGGGGADSIQKEIEKINKEVDKARKDAMDAENDAFMMIWKLKQDTAEMYAAATKGQYEIKGLYKDSYDTLGSISPVMGDQVAYQKKALDLEMEIEKYTLKTKLEKLGINKAQELELMGLQALTAQAKKFNKEMESDKGIRGWAYGRSKEAEGRNTIKDMMGGLESGFQNAFSSGLQGVLAQEKKTLKDIGKTMFQGLFGEITKGSITKMFDSASKMLRPESPDVAGQLGTAAQGLQKASVGFNTNTAQFGLAAGGLLLSGIGIATNSQMLVYAGAVLQIAGLAIQLYEALTATTTVATMTLAAGALTASAGALTGAAMMLMASAAVDMIPFFHSGGVITAHTGWPRLKSDEVPIIAQTGERVLSRSQNRDYEAGAAAGGGGRGGGLSIGAIHIDARGASADIDWKKVVRTQVGPELKKLAKEKRLRLG